METNRDEEFWIRLQGQSVKLFLKNNFCYRGKLLAVCNGFLDIDDIKGRKILRISEVDNVEVLE